MIKVFLDGMAEGGANIVQKCISCEACKSKQYGIQFLRNHFETLKAWQKRN